METLSHYRQNKTQLSLHGIQGLSLSIKPQLLSKLISHQEASNRQILSTSTSHHHSPQFLKSLLLESLLSESRKSLHI